jgi:outer membrane protein insertion porin family
LSGISFKKLLFSALVLWLFTVSHAYALEETAAKITDIQITGNKKVETETIRSKMSVKAGDVFLPSRIRADISAIYGMGYFSDVKVDAEGYEGGLRLIFNLVERPIISSFTFEGNKEIESSKLREKVNLTSYSVYNPSLVEENVERLRLFYQGEGYYNAQVLPVIKESARDVKVTFKINEGGKVIIRKINFTGNEKISSGKLRKAMTTKKYTPIWSWLMKTGTYKVVDFSQDIERIKALYYNNGYIQVNVGEPQVVLSEDRKSLTITIPIHEGEQFRYNKIDISGNTVFTKDELLKDVESKPGQIMNRDLLKQDVVSLSDLYGTKGYAFATITPIINPDVPKKEVDVTLDVNEGDKIFVNRINVSGNVKTRDKVIRRELKLTEGGIYDTSSIKKSYERLKNLDFFEDVEIVPERKGRENTVDLDVKVKEKSTGTFSIGGGYSSVDRLVALGEVTQNNFLGRGEMVRFKGEFGKRRQNYVLSFTEPWLLDMPVSLRLDLFKEERVYNGYSKKSTGGSISLGRRFWDYYGTTVSYSYSDEKYFDVIDSIKNNPIFQETVNLHTTGKVGLNFYRDSRDNYLDTRRGSNNSVYAEYAGTALGGDNAFYKVIGDSTWYFPFVWDTAFSLHGRIGYSEGLQGRQLPLYERFYVGGIGTVRGFDFGACGPRENGEAIGGNKELIFNAEYMFPLLPSIRLRGVAFFDAGNAFGNGERIDVGSLRYSAGAGIRWMSPMGLIRLEYGFVLDRKAGERPSKLEFTMGSMF